MTAKEKQEALISAGFKKRNVWFNWLFFTRNKFNPVPNLIAIKGISPKLGKLNPTMKGRLNENEFLLEVDNCIWTKTLA